MSKRYVSIWFPHLITDWLVTRKPELKALPFVLAEVSRGRKVITFSNTLAEKLGAHTGMAVADARAIIPSLEVMDDLPGQDHKLLTAIGHLCIRFTPVTAIDPPHGLILDVSGCAHLWNGEVNYLKDILSRLRARGYEVRAAIADTIGAAWANARFGKVSPVIKPGQSKDALLNFPPAALRLEPATIERLHKLGLTTIKRFISMPRSSLQRRFGENILLRIDQALGMEPEAITPLEPVKLYEERLPCLEPIMTRVGIDIALRRLLDTLCERLTKESKGLRICVFKGYRVDGKIESISIGTNHPSSSADHLFKLFEIHVGTIEPDLGIELFTLDATKVEELTPAQEMLWADAKGLNDRSVVELFDRLSIKLGAHTIKRYLPDEHYWPERSLRPAVTLTEKKTIDWQVDRPRPIQLLNAPQRIEVTAPVPDYPPMNFRYRGKLHTIKKADGPERIEREWWIDEGQHRDYYYVEDEEGQRYWLFRLGHYDDKYEWFIHGFFA